MYLVLVLVVFRTDWYSCWNWWRPWYCCLIL